MAKQVYSLEVNLNRIGKLTCNEVKEGLTAYVTGKAVVEGARWDMARGFKLAYAHADDEKTVNDKGEQVLRWKNKHAFNEWVGISDQNSSMLFGAVDYDERHEIEDGRKLSDCGFSIGKVYAMKCALEDKDGVEVDGVSMVGFIEYAMTVLATDRIQDVVRLSDKSIMNMLKVYVENNTEQDAGTQDAGTDAGTQDAGTDTGTQDAGTQDAGTDAGTQDAGTQDAGTQDAGTQDAGTDAGTQDAGTPEMTEDEKSAYILSMMESIGIDLLRLCEYKRNRDGLTVKWDVRGKRFSYSAK